MLFCRAYVLNKPEAYGDSGIDVIHIFKCQFAHFFFKAFFVYRTNLLQKNYGIFCKTAAFGIELDVCRKFCLVASACNGGGNNCGTVFVTDVVLYDKNGSYTALLRAYYGT